MFSRDRKKGTTRFMFQPRGDVELARVQLVGNFNDWTPRTMRRRKDGSYAASVKLTPGTHEYKFIVDGQWLVDPDNSAWAVNPFGTLNSVVQVE